MDEKNKRFHLLRDACEKTQEEWGEIIGLSRSGVSEIESGRRKVSNKHLKMLEAWNERKINPDYLLYGMEPMFLEPVENPTFAIAGELLGEKDPVFEAFLVAYGKLNKNNRKIITDFYNSFAKEMEKRNSAAIPPHQDNEV